MFSGPGDRRRTETADGEDGEDGEDVAERKRSSFVYAYEARPQDRSSHRGGTPLYLGSFAFSAVR